MWLAGLEKNGGSRLQGYDRWESEDTLELWERCKGTKKCYQAVGWGRANADQNGSSGSLWQPKRDAQKNARNDGGEHSRWSGVPALYDIANKDVKQRAELGLDFVVAVARPENRASRRVMEKIGMRYDYTGEFYGRELVHYIITREEFLNSKTSIDNSTNARVF